MNQKNSFWPIVLALVAIVIAIAAIVMANGGVAPGFGSSTPGTRFPHGVTIGAPGSSPTNLALVQAGTCNATMAATLVATSSGAATCTVTGALAGDIVAVQLPQAGAIASVFGGFLVSGTKATTDTITFNIFNETGVATTSFPLATTSVSYQVYRAQ